MAADSPDHRREPPALPEPGTLPLPAVAHAAHGVEADVATEHAVAAAERSGWLRWLAGRLRLPVGSCALCGDAGSDGVSSSEAGSTAVCDACSSQHLRQATAARCPCCALPGTGGARCGGCQSAAPAFDTTIVACDYAAPTDQLVQALKFRACLALAPVFARQMAHAWQQQGARAELPWHPTLPILLPVPLSRERLAARGFNQALEIAKPLARALGLPLAAALGGTG